MKEGRNEREYRSRFIDGKHDRRRQLVYRALALALNGGLVDESHAAPAYVIHKQNPATGGIVEHFDAALLAGGLNQDLRYRGGAAVWHTNDFDRGGCGYRRRGRKGRRARSRNSGLGDPAGDRRGATGLKHRRRRLLHSGEELRVAVGERCRIGGDARGHDRSELRRLRGLRDQRPRRRPGV